MTKKKKKEIKKRTNSKSRRPGTNRMMGTTVTRGERGDNARWKEVAVK